MAEAATTKVNRYEWWIFTATAASLSLLLLYPTAMRTRTEGALHPHGFCYIWDPVLVWSHVSADLAIGVAYVAISLTLGVFVYRVRHLLPFHWMFLAFGLFILTCGATHLMDVWTLWFADFWASAALKIVTAVASLATAVALPPLIPQAIRLLKAAEASERRREELLAARRQQEATEQESRAKDVFLATLSHELRTPLNAISGWAHVLRATGVMDHDERTRKAIDAIQRNAAHQARLVEDMLDLSSIASGRLPLAHSRLDFVEVVRHAVEAARPEAAARGLQFTCHVPERPLPMVGDAGRLQQVAGNLLSNALKFTDPPGTIEVRLSQDGPWALLTVRDSGIGIDPGVLPTVFEDFVQGDQSSTRARGGLGLGLSIVRHLVERHGGTVTALSEGPRKGATFEVRLPLA